MGRSISKKGASRQPARTKHRRDTAVREKLLDQQGQQRHACLHCTQDLGKEESRVLFVEEEVGRVFCSESCIVGYFSPEIKRLEKEYFKWQSTDELSDKERKDLAELRWSTLEKPDEVWKEKTGTGDYRFTLITRYKKKNKPVWCICMCLFLRGEPSFLYLAFPTRNAKMLAHYRRGERIERKITTARDSASEADAPPEASKKPSKRKIQSVKSKKQNPDEIEIIQMDGLATEWTEEETLMAQLISNRSKDDIPTQEFQSYQGCVNETLEGPDEVWSLNLQGSTKLIHFMRYYPDEDPKIWYIVVARQNEEEEGIEILDAFPTRDYQLVDCYRKGEQQVGGNASEPQLISRTVH